MMKNNVAIIGTAGVPANYGGFETLTEYLVHFLGRDLDLTVYCSSKLYPARQSEYKGAKLKYVALDANGAQSIPYDIISLFQAARTADTILILGVSGCVVLPLFRLFYPRKKLVINIDGLEHRRDKWGTWARRFLKLSESVAVRFGDAIITDNKGIQVYVQQEYRRDSHLIAYGGDHAAACETVPISEYCLPERYAFSVCRIEPENNVHMIVDAFARGGGLPLVMVGNWESSEYGREIRSRYVACENIHLLDPIYDLGKLKTLRSQSLIYLHGHSAGGTNPSLVEAMWLGCPVLAFDCNFNRYTTENKALYFSTAEELAHTVATIDQPRLDKVGTDLLEVAQRRYRWETIAKNYFDLLDQTVGTPKQPNLFPESDYNSCGNCRNGYGPSGFRQHHAKIDDSSAS